LTELKEKPPVVASWLKTRDLSVERQWLRENRHFYLGLYLALSGDQLIAYGTEGVDVLEQTTASGKDFMVSRVMLDGEIYGGGML